MGYRGINNEKECSRNEKGGGGGVDFSEWSGLL